MTLITYPALSIQMCPCNHFTTINNCHLTTNLKWAPLKRDPLK